jgi:hypothetical protein
MPKTFLTHLSVSHIGIPCALCFVMTEAILETNSSMKKETAYKEEFNIIPRMLNALIHPIPFLFTSQASFLLYLHFLCVINSDNTANFYNQNSALDIMESIKQVIKLKAIKVKCLYQ